MRWSIVALRTYLTRGTALGAADGLASVARAGGRWRCLGVYDAGEQEEERCGGDGVGEFHC